MPTRSPLFMVDDVGRVSWWFARGCCAAEGDAPAQGAPAAAGASGSEGAAAGGQAEGAAADPPPARVAPPPPRARSAPAARASAAQGATAEIPPEVEAAVLAKAGIASLEDLDGYNAWKRAQEEAKPDIKARKEIERVTRAHGEVVATNTKLSDENKHLKAQLAEIERARIDERFGHWLDGFASQLGGKIGLYPEAASDLREYLDRRFSSEGEGDASRLVFVDGKTKIEATSAADADELLAKLAEHVTKNKAHWIDRREHRGAGTGMVGRSLPGAPAPGRRPGDANAPSREGVLQFLGEQAKDILARSNGHSQQPRR